MQPTNGSLIQQWFNAGGLNTEKLMKLSENTNGLSAFLTETYTRLATNQESTAKIVSMSRRILSEFEACYYLEKKGQNPLKFEKWAAAHSRMGPEGHLEGVYQDLHTLFEAIRYIEAMEGIANANTPQAAASSQLQFLQTIENDVQNTFKDDWKSISLPNQKDIQREILLQDIKMGGKMKMTSKDYYAVSRSDFVNLLNQQAIDLSSLGMKSIQDLIAVLGDDCVKITNLVIPYNFQQDSSIGEKILKHFPNLTCLSIQISENQLIDQLNLSGFPWDTDFSSLGGSETLIQIDLRDAKEIKNEHLVSLASLPNLSLLDISGCTQITDFKFLELLESLETLIAEAVQIPEQQLMMLKEKDVIVVT